jgi:hypothetical protein
MRSDNETNEAVVTVNRSMLNAMFAISWLGIWVTAGLVIALAQRAGASPVVANATGFSVAGLLMYPYFAIRLRSKEAGVPKFGRWAVQWIAASAVGSFIATRVIDMLWR